MKGKERMVLHVEDHDPSALDRAATAALFLIALWSFMGFVFFLMIWVMTLLT